MSDIHLKITDSRHAVPTQSDTTKAGSGKKEDASFDSILSEKIQPHSRLSATDAPASLSELQGTFRAQQIRLIQPDHQQLSDKMTASLDLFEQYTAFLGDPDKSLKQSYALLEQVLSQLQGLTQELDQAADTNPGTRSGQPDELKTILTQLMTTARVEQIKFDRGDYL